MKLPAENVKPSKIRAERFLDTPALANRAGSTICDLARGRGLRDRNKVEFGQALSKVVAACTKQAVIDRAKRRLQEK